MPANWLYEWWLLSQEEPWGEDRADLRAWAHAIISMGSQDVQLVWPYIDPGLSPEELQSEIDRLEAAINRNKQHGNRSENHDCD
jgi:hypothetical protein